MNIISPYRNVEQYTKIIIEPHQMNSDITNHMKFNLKKKVEKKCNKNGFVVEVYRIITYSDGIMIPENLSGNAIYDISYHCKICVPIENSIIICQIKITNQELVFATNGPIMVFIPRDNVDPTYWNDVDNFTYKQNKDIKLTIGNFVCVQIINKRINNNDPQINAIGRLLDLATDEQVQKYFGNEITSTLDTVEKSNYL